MESSLFTGEAGVNDDNEFCNLPDVLFARIVEYLEGKDVLNLRLACSNLYNLSNSRECFKKFIVKVEALDTVRLLSLQNLLEKYGIYLSLKLVHVQEFFWRSLLPYLKNTENVEINDWQLEDVCQNCINTEKLMIHLKGSDHDDLYTRRERNIFTCLGKLRNLDELVLQPDEYYYLLKPSILLHLLNSAKTIAKIKFIGYFYICENEDDLEDPEVSAMEELQKFIECPNNLKKWEVQRLVTPNPKYTLMFPYSMTWLDYGPWCENFVKLENLRNIEKLSIHGQYFLRLSAIKYPNLRELTIGYYKDCEFNLDGKVMFLPKLKFLTLKQVQYLNPFERLLLPTLERLNIESVVDLTEDFLKLVLAKCVSLKELVILLADRPIWNFPKVVISASFLKRMVNSIPGLKIKFRSYYFADDRIISSKYFDDRVLEIEEETSELSALVVE